jgi:hypothetical protein
MLFALCGYAACFLLSAVCCLLCAVCCHLCAVCFPLSTLCSMFYALCSMLYALWSLPNLSILPICSKLTSQKGREVRGALRNLGSDMVFGRIANPDEWNVRKCIQGDYDMVDQLPDSGTNTPISLFVRSLVITHSFHFLFVPWLSHTHFTFCSFLGYLTPIYLFARALPCFCPSCALIALAQHPRRRPILQI